MEIFVVTVKGSLIDTEVHSFKNHDDAIKCVHEILDGFDCPMEKCEEVCYECWKGDCMSIQDFEIEVHHSMLK